MMTTRIREFQNSSISMMPNNNTNHDYLTFQTYDKNKYAKTNKLNMTDADSKSPPAPLPMDDKTKKQSYKIPEDIMEANLFKTIQNLHSSQK